MSATLGSFAIAEFLPQRAVAILAILFVAAFKVRLILHRFMDLRTAPFSWRAIFDVWTMACATLIVGLSWYAAAR